MKKSIFCFLLIAFFFSQSQLFSQDEAWERIQPTPQEHSLYCVRQIPGTDRIVAVGDGSTIMFSEDEGETWDIHLNPAGLPNNTGFLSINFFDELNGYVAANYGKIIRTTDGGQSWELIYNNQDDYLLSDRIDIYLKDAETAIVVGYDDLVLKTTDGGETWETSISPEGFFPNSIGFVDDNTGYIVGRTDLAQILKTVDGGDNWITQPFNALSIPSYYDIYFIDENEGIISGSDYGEVFIFKTIDAGNNWDLVYSSTIANDIGEIDFKDGLNGAINTYSWNTSFLYSTDGGDTWEYDEEYSFPGSRYCYSFAYLPNLLIGVSVYGLIGRLTDFGEEWESLSARTSFDLCRNIQFTSEQTGYSYFTHRGGGVPSGGIIKTTDGGNSWSNFLFNTYYNGDFCFLDDDVGFFVGTFFSTEIHTIKTINGGDDWYGLSDLEPDNSYVYDEPIAIEYFDANHGLLAFSGKIYKSSQIGEYWQEIYGTHKYHYMTDIAYLSIDTFVITSYNDGNNASPMLIWSYDGGKSFEFETLDFDLYLPNSIYFRDSLTAFVPFENGNTILKSIDGGHNWYTTIINDTNIASYKNVYFPSEEIGYAVGTGEYSTMYKTTYEGYNWHTSIVDDTSKSSNRKMFFPSNDFGYEGGSGEYTTLLKSTDGGETWDPIAVPCTSGLTEVYFHDDWHGFVFGSNGVILETFTGGILGLEVNPFVSNSSVFTLSPNPATDKIQIDLSEIPENNLVIEVFNLNGTRLFYEISTLSQNKVSLNIENYPPGIYFCRVINGSSVTSSRFLKL